MNLPIGRKAQIRRIERLYEEHAPALLLYARSFGIERMPAEDIVHRVFLKLIEAGKEPREPRPYLFRAVRNTVLNWLRGTKVQEPLEDHANSWFQSDPVHNELRIDLEVTLSQLSPEQKDVLIMRLWGGLSFAEIATALDISPNTIASRYRYALAALREKLQTTKAVK